MSVLDGFAADWITNSRAYGFGALKGRAWSRSPCWVKEEWIHEPSLRYAVRVTGYLGARLCAGDVCIAGDFLAVLAFIAVELSVPRLRGIHDAEKADGCDAHGFTVSR